MMYLNTPHTQVTKLAEAIYDFLDYYGINAIEDVEDVLTGETSVEDFIEMVENDRNISRVGEEN